MDHSFTQWGYVGVGRSKKLTFLPYCVKKHHFTLKMDNIIFDFI